MNIKYLKNKEIDKPKWDNTINKSINGRIYAYSWYLDSLADNWDALVTDEYEYIMPLPWRQKYNIPYIYPVFFIQQLGVFSSQKLSDEIYIQFLNAIPSKYRHIHMPLNTDKLFEYPNAVMQLRTNYILNLNRPYSEIYAGYNRDAKKNLKRNNGIQYIYAEHFDINDALAMYEKFAGIKIRNIKSEDYSRLGKAIKNVFPKGSLICRKLMDDRNNILALVLFFYSRGRAYYIIGTQTLEGRKVHAIHFLLDYFIQEFSEKINILDFEGSDAPGVADFFKKWGGVVENYVMIKIRKFPFNLFK